MLEAPVGHVTFSKIKAHFEGSWQAGPLPQVKRVFAIVLSEQLLAPYNAYRQSAGPKEAFLYHGTTRACSLESDDEDTNQVGICAHMECKLCSIVESSYNIGCAKRSGAFGPGIYTSSASNKAHSYAPGSSGVLLLNKVVTGYVKTVSAFNEVEACPPGYDSVVFDRQEGTLNETVLYSEDAIRPMFLLTF